jgi:hypothetical protein
LRKRNKIAAPRKGKSEKEEKIQNTLECLAVWQDLPL